MRAQNAFIAAAAVIALVSGVWLGGMLPGSASHFPQIQGTAFPDPRPLPDFQLIDQDGAPFTRERLEGTWTLVYFGYTSCPDVCPTTLYDFARTEQLLAERDAGGDVNYLLVSVDPERDTPERLAQYLRHFSERLAGATGSSTALEELTKPLGIVFARVDGDDPHNYLVDHSSAVIVVNPEAAFQALFSIPHRPEDMADDLIALKHYFDR